jgi:hypothetical protein
MGALGLSGIGISSANTKAAWAPSETEGFNNGQRENRAWSYPKLRFSIVVQLSGKQAIDNDLSARAQCPRMLCQWRWRSGLGSSWVFSLSECGAGIECVSNQTQVAASDTSAASLALAPAGMVAEFINSPMRSGLQSYVFYAAVAFLAACQSPPVNQGIQPNKPGFTAGEPTTPSSYEVDSFDLYHREIGIGLRGSSYFGRGPWNTFPPSAPASGATRKAKPGRLGSFVRRQMKYWLRFWNWNQLFAMWLADYQGETLHEN